MNIAVFRALQLGDLLCAVPALRAVKTSFAGASITLIGLPWARAFVARFRRYIDDFAEFPGFPGTYAFFKDMQRRNFDLVVQMHGDGSKSNAIARGMAGRHIAGFYLPGAGCPDPERFVEWRAEESEVLRCVRLAERLGACASGAELEFPLFASDWAEWRALGVRDYACVHPGSQLPSRRWPPERFAAIADALASDGLRVVLTGTAAEAAITRRVAQAMRGPSLDLAGRTSLGALGALIAQARLVLCNDTSISHIAAAVRTPSVVICCGADPRRWAPLDRGLHRVLYHEVECRPCMHVECPIGHPCASGVSVAAVKQEVSRMLACAA